MGRGSHLVVADGYVSGVVVRGVEPENGAQNG